VIIDLLLPYMRGGAAPDTFDLRSISSSSTGGNQLAKNGVVSVDGERATQKFCNYLLLYYDAMDATERRILHRVFPVREVLIRAARGRIKFRRMLSYPWEERNSSCNYLLIYFDAMYAIEPRRPRRSTMESSAASGISGSRSMSLSSMRGKQRAKNGMVSVGYSEAL